jgi:hypothetical protein
MKTNSINNNDCSLCEAGKEKYKLFIGFKKLGEFDSISQAKRYARDSGLSGAFNLLGDKYQDAWYVFEYEIEKKKAET